MITHAEIAETTRRYLALYPNEKADLAPLLEAIDAGDPLATRTRLAGHVTCGAVVLDDEDRVLHIQHLALDRLLLPGGHTEDDDTTLVAAALRELAEETGLGLDAVRLIGDGPIHIDVHTIPASLDRNEPEHWHADFRFLFALTGKAAAVTLQTEEVAAATWTPVRDVASIVLRNRIGSVA